MQHRHDTPVSDAGVSRLLLRRRTTWWTSALAASVLLVTIISLGTEDTAKSWPWYLSRATGFVAYVGLWVTTVSGILTSLLRGAPRRRAVAQDWHRVLSLVTWTFVTIHAAALLFDTYVGYSVWDLVIPFATRHDRLAIGLGIIATEAGLAVAVSFTIRRHLGPSVWRVLHWLSYPVWLLAWIHVLMAGTDMQSTWVRLAVVASGLVVLTLAGVRLAVACDVLPAPTDAAGLTRPHRRVLAALSMAGALLGLVTAHVVGQSSPVERLPVSSEGPASPQSPPVPAPGTRDRDEIEVPPDDDAEMPAPITRSRGS